MIAMRPYDGIVAHNGHAVLLEINTNLILVSYSYIVPASLQSLHKTYREIPACSTYTVLCAMMRTAQQQAVAWFTLSRGVLVHATLTSTQLKSVAHTIQSVE